MRASFQKVQIVNTKEMKEIKNLNFTAKKTEKKLALVLISAS